MKKLTTLIAIFLLCAVSLFAQAPEKFTYQAVVRNASNALVANTQVGVRVNILQGSATGNAVYSETHIATTNANGLITVNIGGGSVLHGSFAGIDWSDGSYFLKTDIDPNGGNDYSITSTQQLLSVPYALYAKDAGNGFSGDYNDLVNVPQIPQIPADISAFNNDAGYITGYTETDPQYNAWNKDYNDLINKPVIPVVPTNVSAFNNDAGYVTTQNVPTVPTNVSAFTNDAGYITLNQIPAQMNADWNATSGASLILNKPTLFSGNYNDLTNKPMLFDGSYNSLSNRPNLSAVAISGSYNDLINKPSIPTAVGELTNNVGYVTLAQVPAQVNADWNATNGVAQILNKPTLFSGNYNDLTNKPTIPTVPTNVSAFTNDAGYVTAVDVQQASGIPTVVSAFQNDAGYITAAQVPAQVNADWNATSGKAMILNKPTLFSGNYNDLTNKPTLFSGNYNDLSNKPTLFDGNYNSLTNKPNLATVAITGNYNDLSNKPTLFSGNYNDLSNKPTIPAAANNATLTIQRNGSSVGTFSADASTNKTINIAVPTTTSELTNNSGFVTEAQLNALLAAMNNTIDSLRDRIEELENGGTPVNPNPSIPDTTIPVIPIIVDGQACPGRETIYDIDGNPYPTVVIGQQCWMKTNLRTTHYSDGTTIALGSSTSAGAPLRYYPGNSSSNLSTFGYLYNWHAVMNGNESSTANPSMVQGICPSGWHVPSNSEWSQLRNYVNSYAGFQCSSTNEYIAKALCSPERWNSTANSPCAVGYTPSANNNATGFSALPAGYLLSNSNTVGKYANLWSCTQSNSSSAYVIQMRYDSPIVEVYADRSMNGFCSVRCVFDSAITGGGAQAVVTGFVNNVTSTTAQCGGSVVTDNGYSVTERGVCWSTSNPPMVYHNRTIDGAGMGSFVSSLTGLIPGTTYYVRAYAITNAGTIYGGIVNFTTPTLCGISTVKDYDLNEYHTVQIGNQCWLKENLRSTHYADGDYISSVSNVSSSSAAYYYAPSGSIENGYLYNWKAVMRSSSSSSANPSGVQGICPTGWHVPSDQEWAELENFVGNQDSCLCSSNQTYIAKALAANSGWTSNTGTCVVGNGQNNNNKTGFSALPVGYLYYRNSFYHSGTGAYFWSATQTSTDDAWCRSLQNNSASVSRNSAGKNDYGYSVRCLRD